MQVYDFDRNQLKELIEQYFSFDGINNLCSSLGISPDNVKGNTKREKAKNLIEHCQNRSRLPDLLEELKKERPNVPWEQEVVVRFDSKQIAQNLNKLQLEKVCRKLNVFIENLSGEEIEEKVEALLKICKQSGQLRKLLTILEQEQPHVTWTTQLTERVSPDGCSGQIGRLKWMIVLIGSFTILFLGLFYLSTSYVSDKTAQATLAVAHAIQETATAQAMVVMATPSPTFTPSDTPSPSPSPTPTLTPTLTPTPITLPQTQSIVEVEVFAGDYEVNSRSNASKSRVVLLQQGNKLSIPFQLAQTARYNLRVRYSNDTGGVDDPSLEQIIIAINGEEIGRFQAKDTLRDSEDVGSGWNEFRLSPAIDTTEMAAGFHELDIQVIGGDGHGVEIDAIIFVPFPYAYIVTNFEEEKQVDWFTLDEGVYSYSEVVEPTYSGNKAFSIEYNKSDTYQFIGAALPPIMRDFSEVALVQLQVYGEVCILLKLEDENFFGIDIDEKQCSEQTDAWTSLQFTMEDVGALDLTRVRTLLFFIEPGEDSASGTIILDDIVLMLSP
jgi:hypothetical protein